MIACRLRKTPAADHIIEDFQRSNMNRPMRTGCSVIAFVNSETPLLNFSISKILCLEERVKKQIPRFRDSATMDLRVEIVRRIGLRLHLF